VVFGGFDGEYYSSQTWRLNVAETEPLRWQRVSASQSPEARELTSLTYMGTDPESATSRFLLFGGYSDESATTSDLYELSLPQSDGVGSHDGWKVIDAVWDPSQLVQMRQKNEVDHVNDDGRDSANTFPQSRQGHAALRHDKELIIIGGCQMQNNRKVACFSDAWAFHSEKKNGEE